MTAGRLASLALCLALSCVAARASVTGSISGVVSDPSGAVIPQVKATVVNTQTGIAETTNANSSGFYAFTSLVVGRYDLSFEKSGFEVFRQSGLMVDVNTALRVDVTLKVGVTKLEVTVSSTAVHVETNNTQMGEVIGSTDMTAFPLNGRSYTDLLALQPGVVPVPSGEFLSPSPSGDLNPGNLSVSGQRESANGFMVNGGNVEEGMSMGTAIIPDLDSLAEFRIITNNFDAEYGNYSGGLINAVTKSGTNQVHGDAFEFLRNPHLDSRNFYSPSRGTFHRNQFGGTSGGPIRRDQAFFFGDYQGTRQVIGVDTGLIPVPSNDERNGIFGPSAFGTIGSNPSGHPVFTPNTVSGPYWANLLTQKLGYNVSAGEPYTLYDPIAQVSLCTNTAQCVFPGGVIPSQAFSGPAQALMKYIPPPNAAGNNFVTSALRRTLRDDKWSARVDGKSRWGMLSAYYFFDDYNLLDPYPVVNLLPGFSQRTFGRAQDLNLSDTKTFGGTAVNELRLNFLRNAFFLSEPVGGVGPTLSSLGFVEGCNTLGICPLSKKYEGVPPISFNNFSMGTTFFFGYGAGNTYQALDNFSKVLGAHTVKFGASFHWDQFGGQAFFVNDGAFGFTGTETGSDFTDFLLGAASNYQQGEQLPVYTRSKYVGLYAQDSWRARPNLTLNYGLRWDVTTPWYELHNELETMVVDEQSFTFPGAPKGWVVAGDPGIPRTVAPVRYDNFAPRIGLAYSPKAKGGLTRRLFGGPGKSSIRAGFGIFYTAFEDLTNIDTIGQAPFGYFWGSPAPPLFRTPFIDLSTGFPEGQRFPTPVPPLNVSPAHPDASINWAQFEPISAASGFFVKNRVPYAEEYMLSIHRQYGTSTLLSLSYVGTQGHRLLATLEANPGNPALCLSVSQTSQVMPGTGTCGPFGENGVYYPVTGGVINGTRGPLGPAFGSDGWFVAMANSNYNALEASLRHTSGRVTLLAAYTYSKAMDNASGNGGGGDVINPLDYKITKSLSAFDLTHNFVASYSLELPFDKFFAGHRGTRGWILTGVTRFSTGLPVFLFEPDDNSLLGTMFTAPTPNGVDEPNFTPGPLRIKDPRSGQPYFDTSLFTREKLGQLGNANRRFFHGPGLNNWDLALIKDFRLRESKTLEFRAEFFNAFNHAQFGMPQGDILSSSFGFATSANSPRIGQFGLKFVF